MGAASDAADTQSAAADRASATQEAARLQQRQDLMPWMQGGQSANNALLYRLGLGGAAGGGRGSALTQDQFRAQLLPQYTRQSTTPGREVAYEGTDDTGHYTIFKDGTRAEGYGDYGPTSQSTVDEAGLNTAIQQAMAQQQAQQGQFQAQASSDPNYGSLLRKFDESDLASDLPYQKGLQFGLKTGTDQLNQRAAAGGSYGSGAALKALTRFGNDYATTKTAGAYDRNMGEKNQIYNFLGGVSQQGQSAAAGVGAAGINTASGIASNQLASGNAQSAGIVGGANALSGGISDITNAYQWNQLLSKNKPANPYAGSSYNPSAANYENSFDRMN